MNRVTAEERIVGVECSLYSVFVKLFSRIIIMIINPKMNLYYKAHRSIAT